MRHRCSFRPCGRERWVETCVDVEVAKGNRRLVGFDPHLRKARFQVAVKGVERLCISAPIEVIKFEIIAVIQEPGPAVRFSAPRAHNLRLVAIVEAAAATGTCIHRNLLSFLLRRMSGCELGLECRKQCRPK